MAKLSNITPGIAVVKEKIKSTAVLHVGINAMGLCVTGTDDETLKSDVIQAMAPAKGLFLNNPRAVCEVSVIDDSFSAIYRIEKRFCITDSIYISPQQISAVCGLPYTPAQRVMLTPKMVLDIQQIMIGQSNVNICEYMKFSSNALSVSGTPVYGLTINNVFIKDRRSANMTRIPDDQWSMSDTFKDIVWKSLVSIAYNVIQQKPEATIDDICQIYIKTYGSSWITKLVVFNNKNNIELPGFMTAVASSSITSEQLINAYQLMVAILRGKFTGVPHMDRDETVEYIKKLQQTVAEKINNTPNVPEDLRQSLSADGTKDTENLEGERKEEEPVEDDKKEDSKKEEPKKEEPVENDDKKEEPKKAEPKKEEPTEDNKKEEPKKEEPAESGKKEGKKEDNKKEDNNEEEPEEADGEETGEENTEEE